MKQEMAQHILTLWLSGKVIACLVLPVIIALIIGRKKTRGTK
jgi:hypothetical protein|tara:strand:+ start:327 stop:452 length:126 start_codon:yes stop_codon:yes gene_type:complete